MSVRSSRTGRASVGVAEIWPSLYSTLGNNLLKKNGYIHTMNKVTYSHVHGVFSLTFTSN